jgi:hypothetical protein
MAAVVAEPGLLVLQQNQAVLLLRVLVAVQLVMGTTAAVQIYQQVLIHLAVAVGLAQLDKLSRQILQPLEQEAMD